MCNTYRISILLTQYLKRYLSTIQKVIPVWMSQNEPKCSWLNNHLQSIQRYSFEDTSALQKHLQLIPQIDAIFDRSNPKKYARRRKKRIYIYIS